MGDAELFEMNEEMHPVLAVEMLRRYGRFWGGRRNQLEIMKRVTIQNIEIEHDGENAPADIARVVDAIISSAVNAANHDTASRLVEAEKILSDLATGHWVATLDERDDPVELKMGQRVLNYWQRIPAAKNG